MANWVACYLLIRLSLQGLWKCPSTRAGAKKWITTKTKQSHMKLFKYTMLAVAVCAAFTMQSAKAGALPFTSLIDTPNDALSGFAGPYGTVEINLLSATTASVTFTSNT